MKRRIVGLLLAIALLVSACGCAVNTNRSMVDQSLSKAVRTDGQGSLDKTDDPDISSVAPGENVSEGSANAKTENAVDSEGRIQAPLDLVYPEAFEQGEFLYDISVILLKMKTGFTGGLTEDLMLCGISSMKKFMSSSKGDWYRATLSGEYDIHSVIQKVRALNDVLIADYDYQYETEDGSVQIDRKNGQ